MVVKTFVVCNKNSIEFPFKIVSKIRNSIKIFKWKYFYIIRGLDAEIPMTKWKKIVRVNKYAFPRIYCTICTQFKQTVPCHFSRFFSICATSDEYEELESAK